MKEKKGSVFRLTIRVLILFDAFLFYVPVSMCERGVGGGYVDMYQKLL